MININSMANSFVHGFFAGGGFVAAVTIAHYFLGRGLC